MDTKTPKHVYTPEPDLLFTMGYGTNVCVQAANLVISILMSCWPSTQLLESVSLRGCSSSCVTRRTMKFCSANRYKYSL